MGCITSGFTGGLLPVSSRGGLSRERVKRPHILLLDGYWMIAPRRSISSRDVARHYDELDGFYRELWGEHVHHGLWLTGRESVEQAVRQLVDHVVREASIGPGSAVCDVGCGYGATARQLAAEHGAEVTAITVSAHQHRYAQAQASTEGSVTYLLQDWLRNELPDETFDAVLFIESLAHMRDKPKALAEAYRVLRPGGRLVACTWLAADSVPGWARRYLLEPICQEGQLPGLPSAIDVRQKLETTGFASPSFDDLSDRVQKTWTVIIGRVLRGLLTRSDYRRYLLDRAQQNRRFALTPIRLWLGFRTGTFHYGLFTAQKPS